LRHPPTLSQRLVDPYVSIGPLGQYALWQSAHELAARRLIDASLAVERYRRGSGGAPPPKIDPRDDPFSGRPLLYKKETDGYVIYAVDVNGKDDGGSLYGFGAAGLRTFGQQTPRDYGIRVPLTVATTAASASRE
jgi:hypothetical protein